MARRRLRGCLGDDVLGARPVIRNRRRPLPRFAGRPHEQRARTSRSPAHRFVHAGRPPFQWRGITAFRLLDYVADRNEAEAEAFLGWAQAQKLTVVARAGDGAASYGSRSRRTAGRRCRDCSSLAAKPRPATSRSWRSRTRGTCRSISTSTSRRSGESLGGASERAARDRQRAGASHAGARRRQARGRSWRSPHACRRMCPVALGSIEADDGFARGPTT